MLCPQNKLSEKEKCARNGFWFVYRENSGFWLRVRARALRVPIFFGSLIHRKGRYAPLPSLIASLLLLHLRKINYFQKQNASLHARTRSAKGVYLSTGPPRLWYIIFPAPRPTHRALPHCKENPIHVFLFWKLRDLIPNFHIHVSVSDLYIPRIGPHISLQQKADRSWKYINFSQIYEFRTGRQNIIILFWKQQFHFWEYINGNKKFYIGFHRPFICSDTLHPTKLRFILKSYAAAAPYQTRT